MFNKLIEKGDLQQKYRFRGGTFMNGRKVLFVEDNKKIMDANSIKFTREGYDVACAPTLTDARNLLRKARPDVIVLDIMLPDGSGLQFIREIRQNEKMPIPILLLSGLASKEDIAHGLKEGGNDYLTKPYDYDELLSRVGALCEQNRTDENKHEKPDTIVLLVDDQPINIVFLIGLLEGECTLLTAKNGRDAIRIAMKKTPDLIVTDVNMPGMSGFDMVMEMAILPETMDIPKIFFTSEECPESEKKGRKLGAVDYIRKNLSPNIIKSRIMTHINLNTSGVA